MRLSGVVPVGLAGLVVVLAPNGGQGLRPLHLAAPRVQAARPLALVWHGNGLYAGDGARLAALNPKTLRVGKRRTSNLGEVDAWAFEQPGGAVLAVSGSPPSLAPSTTSSDTIRFVDVRKLRVLGGGVPLDTPTDLSSVRALLWARPDRLIAVATSTCCAAPWLVFAIDPNERRIVATTPISGEVIDVRSAGDALVLLEAPPDGIGPATLVDVSAAGDVRSVQLDRVAAGTTINADAQGDASFDHRFPALVVDRLGYHAFVLQADGPAADVDLHTLAVSYHGLTAPQSPLARLSAWLTPAAEAKGGNGPERDGVWLGEGRIALTGTDDAEVVRSDGGVAFPTAPAGLAIVDTRDWTVHMLDPRADTVKVSDGVLLATNDRSNGKGIGLAAYGPDVKPKFTLFRPWGVDVWLALDGRAYVDTYNVDGEARIAVVDLVSGRVIGKRGLSVPTPVLADGPTYCVGVGAC